MFMGLTLIWCLRVGLQEQAPAINLIWLTNLQTPKRYQMPHADVRDVTTDGQT
jgi:hypothetical protein